MEMASGGWEMMTILNGTGLRIFFGDVRRQAVRGRLARAGERFADYQKVSDGASGPPTPYQCRRISRNRA